MRIVCVVQHVDLKSNVNQGVVIAVAHSTQGSLGVCHPLCYKAPILVVKRQFPTPTVFLKAARPRVLPNFFESLPILYLQINFRCLQMGRTVALIVQKFSFEEFAK